MFWHKKITDARDKKTWNLAAPTKRSFHFYIDLTKVVQMEIEHYCQALYNIIKDRSMNETFFL